MIFSCFLLIIVGVKLLLLETDWQASTLVTHFPAQIMCSVQMVRGSQVHLASWLDCKPIVLVKRGCV